MLANKGKFVQEEFSAQWKVGFIQLLSSQSGSQGTEETKMVFTEAPRPPVTRLTCDSPQFFTPSDYHSGIIAAEMRHYKSNSLQLYYIFCCCCGNWDFILASS